MCFSDFENIKIPSSIPFIRAQQKIHWNAIEYFLSLFRHSLKFWKSMPVYHIIFILLYEKRQKKWYNPKNEQYAKLSIFYGTKAHESPLNKVHLHRVTLEAFTSCQYPYICSHDPRVHTPPLGLSFLTFMEKLCHPLCHCLRVITILQVVLPVSLFVSCFHSKDVITWVSFYVHLSYESSLC